MKPICIFGIFVADLCFFSNTIPTRGQTVLGSKHLVGPGGKGSNQAIAAARLGGDVKFITKLGKDNHAEMALALYKNSGMQTNTIIQDSSLTTGVAGIMISLFVINTLILTQRTGCVLCSKPVHNTISMVTMRTFG